VLVFDTDHRSLTEWYQWLEDNGLELGRDYHWAVERKTGRWAIRLRDGRQEIFILLQSQGFIHREEPTNEQDLDH
jgi:hypothetical protein